MEAFHVQVLVVTVNITAAQSDQMWLDLRYCKVYIDKHPENVIAFKLNGFTIHVHVLFQSASVDIQMHMHHTPHIT